MNQNDYESIVKDVLEHPFNYQWELQGFGMLRTYIDKDTRLQIWLKKYIVEDVTDVHTHPWDFTSYIYQGKIVNNCYSEHPFKVSPNDNEMSFDRCLILTGENAYVKEKIKVLLRKDSSIPYRSGETYHHDKTIPHRIDFIDGTITILSKRNIDVNSLAYSYVPNGKDWVSAAPKIATVGEIREFIKSACDLKSLYL